MATLILDRTAISLSHESGALIIHENGARRGSVPIKLLRRVVVQSKSLEWTSGTLAHIVEHGAAVLVLSPRHARQSALVLGPRHNDATIRLAQAEFVTEGTRRVAWARRLIALKLRRQEEMLATLEQRRPDRRRALRAGVNVHQRAMSALRSTASIPSIRGVEGAAAAAYFRALGEVFPPALKFSGRNRRPPRDPVNACLSLGYTLLHFDAVRAAHVAGLDPLIGFYHLPEFGRESLACDLIEPLRARVDFFVWRLFADRTLRAENFKHDRGGCLLGKAGRARFYPDWEAFAGPHRRLLRRQCQVIARGLNNRGGHLLEQLAACDATEVVDDLAVVRQQ
ncbi:MAG: CRISPR-associated endonuclease Cas1 [Gammaproteobacteria bacterium]|nr:CRISPR-associated endonuclease Cas1 [Gammaproteobacteria bacterium]